MLLINLNNLNKDFCSKVLNLLNNDVSLKNPEIDYKPRVVGELVQTSVFNNIEMLGYKKTKTKITKRSMADVEINDDEQNLVRIDVKTHYINSSFSMPNLVSTTRLYKYYQNEQNFFAILMVDYDLVNELPVFTKVWLLPIENLDWDCLSIGSLGNGQIQIKNAHQLTFNYNITRKEWLNMFMKKTVEFCDKQIKKYQKIKNFFVNEMNLLI